MDRNGYSDSLFVTEPGECYVCRARRETARHEVLYGIANRRLAKRDGLWINVCPECHRRIHAEPEHYIWLKMEAQEKYEALYGRDRFFATYGHYYL